MGRRIKMLNLGGQISMGNWKNMKIRRKNNGRRTKREKDDKEKKKNNKVKEEAAVPKKGEGSVQENSFINVSFA